MNNNVMDMEGMAILKEWKSNHIVNIQNLYAFINF